MEWNGERNTNISVDTISVDTYKDHRMAMAFAPAASKTGEVRINDSSVVSKSYPSFWNDIQKAGFFVKNLKSAL